MNTGQNVEEMIIKVRSRLKVEVQPHHRVVRNLVSKEPDIGPRQIDKETLVSESGTIGPRTFRGGLVNPVRQRGHFERCDRFYDAGIEMMNDGVSDRRLGIDC